MAAPLVGQLKSVQVARGFAALAVVAYHAATIQEKYFQVEVLPQFFDGGFSGVDLFFVISGFVMVLTARGRHGKPKEVGKFLWNRFFRIYPTYWAYFFALVPVALFFPSFINASQGGQVDFLSSFFLLPTEILPILLVAWTLTLELWFYLVFAVILFLPERFIVAALAVWFLALIALNWNGTMQLPSPYLELPTNAMALEFVIGAGVALVFRRLNRIVAAISGVAGVIVVILLASPVPADLYQGPGLYRPLTLGIGYGLVLLSITAIEHRGGIGAFGRLAIFGDMSYSIYLGHILVLSLLGRIWAAISGPFGGNVFVVLAWWVFTIAVVLGVGYLSYRLIERPVMRLSKHWRAKVFKPAPRPLVVDAGS